jgi:signal transduction histidine kinase/ligand-binding sensor domain-containing protein
MAGLVGVATAAQSARWQTLADPVFRHIDPVQGLPHSVVTGLVQDRAGFVWIATESGLARWDGYRMTVYRHEFNNGRSLPGNYLNTLLVDGSGRLWIGSRGDGLARYNPERDDFDVIALADDGSASVTVNAMVDDGKGGVWVATDMGLAHVSASGKLERLRNMPGVRSSLPSDRVSALLRDRSGQLWIGTSAGLVRYRDNGFTPIGFAGVAVSRTVRALLQGSDGSILIAMENKGIFKLAEKQLNGSAQPLFDPQRYGLELSREVVLSMVEVVPGQFWFGTRGNGLVVFDQQQSQVQRIVQDPVLKNGLVNNVVRSMLRDRSGLIWVGTERGVSHYDPGQTALLNLFGDPGRANRIGDTDVHAIWVENPDRIWLGLGNHGVDILDLSLGLITPLRPNVSDPEHHLQPHRVGAIGKGPDNKVYFATDHGIYATDLSGGNMQRVVSPFRQADAATSTFLAHEGQFWVGGSEDGLWQIDAAGKLVRPNNVGWTNRLDITSLAPAGKDALWVGSGSGLFWFHPDSGKTQQMQVDVHATDRLNSRLVSTLLFDQRGRLWVGTSSSGLYLAREPGPDGQPRFRRITVRDGLKNDGIDRLLEDRQGTIWASTDDGIARINPQTLQVESLQKGEGGAINSFLAGAGAASPDGDLLFGGIGGLSVVKPEQYQRWAYAAPVVLTELRVGGKPQGVQRFNLGNEQQRLLIGAHENHLEVEFAALDYSAPEHNRYQYWLEGADAGWRDADASHRLAAYGNLKPGHYRLHLRGSNRIGVLGESRILAFEVLPAWYQNWWFQLSGVLAVLSIALLLFGALLRRRTRLLREHQQELQQLVAERTGQLQAIQSELLAANQDLNQVNEDLALWVDTLRHLGEVGQDIAAKLDLASVATGLQRHVDNLLRVQAQALYRVSDDGTQLLLSFGRAEGRDLPDPGPLLLGGEPGADEPAVAEVARLQRERLVPDCAALTGEVAGEVAGPGTRCQTLFVPLTIDRRLLGVMAIESKPGEQYGERERLIFRTLCAYGAIALDNAEAYRQVAATLKTLGDTQAQLVQQAKTASLGTLTAGVAHEINNPANFAYVGSYNLRQQLAQFHQFLLDLAGSDAPDDLLQSLQQRFDQLGESLDAISEGATRIRDLVRDLRTFSRLDEADWKEVAVIDSLKATVNLVRMQYAHQVDIVCDLPVNPVLTCWPAQLNQVFMNLIVNACQAIASRPEARQKAESGRLKISSSINGPWLQLEFEDNGIGMTQRQMDQIFDPFFTTKGVGEGMGMGLSIVLSIIEKHRGRIDVQSDLGVGSCFVLRLPLSKAGTED